MSGSRLVSLCALLIAWVACASGPFSTSASGPQGLARVLASGELRVGMTGDQLPLNHRTTGGEWLGFEVAVMNVLAENLGVRASFVQRPFAELLPALEAGEVDVVMSGVTITPRRNLSAAFVGPYFVSGKSVLAPAGTLAALRKAEDLDRSGLRVAVLAGSTSEGFVRRVGKRATLTPVETLREAIALVVSKRVDALVADYETCALARLRNPEANLEHLEYGLTVEPMGIAIPPEDTLLANLLENYLQALVLNGGLKRIEALWLNDRAWLKRVPKVEARAARPPAG